MSTSGRGVLVVAALSAALTAVLTAACGTTPVTPTSVGANPADAAGIVGQLAVAFLNRFAASNVPAEACILDFADSCGGKADERRDIEFNRTHFQILGARLGAPSVQVAANQLSANIALTCAFDSRIAKCDGSDCVEGSFDHVAGTCTLRGVYEQSRWWLCESHFSGTGSTSPPMRVFFGSPAN